VLFATRTMIRVIEACSGQELVEMSDSAMLWLERKVDRINSLNVFPVPDGDTGINMLLTMHSAVEEAFRSTDRSASANLEAIHSGQPQYNDTISVE
jgi:dihydroxyacetone kinase-like predicted kinase